MSNVELGKMGPIWWVIDSRKTKSTGAKIGIRKDVIMRINASSELRVVFDSIVARVL